MDSGTLRLILIVAGILLLAGIYLFGKKKQNKVKTQAREVWEDLPPNESDEQETPWVTSPDTEGEVLKHELEQLDEAVAESVHVTGSVAEDSEALLDTEPQQELLDEDELVMRATAEGDLPQKILQIIIVSNDEPFTGEAILQAAGECGLQHGEMEIFHHYASHSKEMLFSMASVVEPGNFPLKKMDQISTFGLALFAKLPAAKPGLEIYDEMIATAKKLAEKLDGELLDETRSVLRKQTIEHTREEILEHARQIRLAGRRV